MDYTIAQLFKTLVDQKGSDLHIGANTPPRLRIDGQVVPLDLPPLTPEESKSLCFNVMNEIQKKRFEEHKELDFSFAVKNLARFRANVFTDQGAVAGAFRLIPNAVFSLDDLDLPPILKQLALLPRGLVLVTGPTGSGKSTTLAAMVDYVNTSLYGHIITIEDPIEFVHTHKNCIINQREVGQDTLDFSRALKSALRQDPDVILLGEMRDLETISTAITIAETGHLVFGTLHTNDCVSSINRIIDVFPGDKQSQIRTQLAMTLQAVLSQMLLPARGGGRAMAMEVMVANNPIRALVNEGKITQIYSSIQTGQADSHMQTMNQSLFKLVQKGLITKDQAMAKSSRADELLEMIQGNGQKRKR